MTRSVFIIISTEQLGGAEKRFAGLWNSFLENKDSRQYNVYLVMNPLLYKNLIDAEVVPAGHPNIIVEKLTEKNFITYRSNVKRVIKKYTNKGDIMHFISLQPALLLLNRRVLLSLTLSNFNVEGLKFKWLMFLSVLFSRSVDILDEGVFKRLGRIFFWKRSRFYKTTNSFCDTVSYKPVPWVDKKNWIVFLGRLSPVKQVVELMQALPLIHTELKKKYDQDFHFFILGHGALEGKLKEIKQDAAFKNINLDMYYEKLPHRVLNQSKVFLSLQLYNNYPSRSLLEAMAAGNIPLVTDNGETRTIAKPEFSYYVPEKFTPEQLATQLLNIFSMNEIEFEHKSKLAREYVLEDHTIEKTRDYYQKVYADIFNY